MRTRLAAALLITSALGAAASLARAEVYMWTDEQGVTHYTTDKRQVPEHLREQIEEAAPVAAPAPVAPARPPARAPEIQREEAMPSVEAAPPAPAPESTTTSAPEPAGEPAAPPATEPAPEPPLPPVDAGVEPGDSPEIAQVKEQIAADRERIKQLLAEPGADGETLAGNAELRETGERLARKQAELEGLRSESNP
jgi:hypothetical protein